MPVSAAAFRLILLTAQRPGEVFSMCWCDVEDGEWWVRDNSSRNGAFVNDQKIDEAQVTDGHILRIGATEFELQRSNGAVPRHTAARLVVGRDPGCDLRLQNARSAPLAHATYARSVTRRRRPPPPRAP